jgi:hypothetical protein
MSGINGHIGLLMAGGAAPPVALAVASYAKSGSTSPSTTQAVTMPTGLAAGERLLVVIGYTSNASPGLPSGFASILGGSDGTSGFRSTVAEKIATGSEGASLNFTTPFNVQWNAVALRIVGSDTAAAAQAAHVAMAGSTPQVCPSLTPSWGSAASLWLSVAMGYYNYTMTGFGLTDNHDQNLIGISYPNMSMSTQVITTATETPSSLSWSGGGQYGNLFTVGVKPV